MDWADLEKKYGGDGSAAPAAGWDDLEKKYGTTPKAKPEPMKKEPVSDFSGNLRFFDYDTGTRLPGAINRGLASVGSGIADSWLGLRQMLASDSKTASSLVTGQTDDSKLRIEAADKRKIDADLNDTWVGKGLNLAGKAAPAFAVPVGGVAGGILSGAAMGALEPVAGNESRGANVALGGVLGGAIPGVVAGARGLLAPAAGAATDMAKLAAQKYGIPITAADLSSNKFVQGLRSVVNDLPFIGGIGASANQAKQEAFNKAVGGTFGAAETSLTPAVVSKAKGAITGELNRVWDNNTLKLDLGLMTDLSAAEAKATAKLLPDQAAMVHRHVQELYKAAQNGEIPGGFANNWQSELRQAVDGETGLAKTVLNDVRQAALKAFNRGVAPADADALTLARKQYGNFKTVEPLLTKGELGVAGRSGGDVPAGLLSNQVFSQMGNRAVGTDLGELSGIGSRFLADRTSQTGGSPRAFVQNLAAGSALTGGAGMGGLLAGGAATGAVGAAAGLGTTAIIAKALNSPALARQLLEQGAKRGLLSDSAFTPAVLEALKRSAYAAPAVAGPGLLGLRSD